MKIRSIGSAVAFASSALLLAACSGNPVNETKTSKKITTKVSGKPIKNVVIVKNNIKNQSLNNLKAKKKASLPVKYASTPKRAVQAPKNRPQLLAKVVQPKPTKRVNVRKAHYKKPIKRAVSRIDPNLSFGYALSGAAVERTKQRVRYDGKYLKIGYPWGDVPKSIGVCTDVVIRSYRRLGIDLQQEVHKDISQDFYAYPNLVKWGLSKPDPNIDHRRVYNLQAFFKRHKAELPRSRNPQHYKPGDLVTWMVGPNFPHIGVVVNKPSKADPKRLMIAHNIGRGPQVEDILFRFPMTGHYRYTPKHRNINPSLLYAKTKPPASVLLRQKNKSLSYADLLRASEILSNKTGARRSPSDLLVRKKNTKAKEKILLASLDASLLKSGEK